MFVTNNLDVLTERYWQVYLGSPKLLRKPWPRVVFLRNKDISTKIM